MNNTNLYFNILTFCYPKTPITLYFSEEKKGECFKINSYIFPNNLENIFPDYTKKGLSKIYTTFNKADKSFTGLEIDFNSKNVHLYKRYLNNKIEQFFKDREEIITTRNFVGDIQVWIKNNKLLNDKFNNYYKFTLKIQFNKVSKFPELIIAFDGQSKVLKMSVTDILEDVPLRLLKKVIFNSSIIKYQKIDQDSYQKINLSETHPILNRDLSNALNIKTSPIRVENKYIKYKDLIDSFTNNYLLKDEFKKIIPINIEGYLPVPLKNMGKVDDSCNDLVFKNGNGRVPKLDFSRKKPLKKPKHRNIELFYIYHESHTQECQKLHKYFLRGTEKYFTGLESFAGIPYHPNMKIAIKYYNDSNPLPEIIEKLQSLSFDYDTTYVAIYISPIDKYTQDKQKRNIYYRVKEELLKRKIISQTIDYGNLKLKIDSYHFELNNISLALLAKLQGVPWKLKTSDSRDLIIGIGAFKNIEENINYTASAFSFHNNGTFNEFTSFSKSNTQLLSGAICNAISEFHAVENNPDKVVIHFYKEMSKKEIDPIIDKMNKLELGCPLYIVNINKTDSEDIIAFDTGWHGKLMPKSGTFIKIGWNQYLLFNNSRYSNDIKYPYGESYSFPIKLSISSPTEGALDDVKTNKLLIEQVYQFSRLYWKSLRQQNVPVTIKYPEMLAEIAPNFKGTDMPSYGKDKLWFL